MRDGSRRLLARMIQAAIVAVSVSAVLVYANPAFLRLPYLYGVPVRSPYCTLWKASQDAEIAIQQGKTTDRLHAASRVTMQEGGLELWDTPAGPFWVPSGNPHILSILLAQQRRNIYGANGWGVRKGDIVIDCGAHVGVYTKKALSEGARLVIAVEPSPDAVKSLRRNLAAEIAAGRVIIYPKGIWDSEQTLTFYINGNSDAGNSFINKNAKSTRVIVPVNSIDGLVQELKLPRVDFIKADVKGATERMLQGAATTLVRFRPRLALSTEEPPENPASLAELVNRLAAKSYEMTCGPCLIIGGEVSTDVVFFRGRERATT